MNNYYSDEEIESILKSGRVESMLMAKEIIELRSIVRARFYASVLQGARERIVELEEELNNLKRAYAEEKIHPHVQLG